MLGYVAFVCAMLGLAALAMVGVGKYAAIGLGIFAVAAGIVAYRRHTLPAARRLAGAGGVALGLVALGLGGLKVGLTLVVLERLLGLQ